jgi:hypothetical protein
MEELTLIVYGSCQGFNGKVNFPMIATHQYVHYAEAAAGNGLLCKLSY